MRWAAISAAAGFMLAGCVSDLFMQKKQDIDFVEGCWIAKEGTGVNYRLRLLRDGDAFAGPLLVYPDGKETEDAHITLSRDGSQAVIVAEGRTWTYTWAKQKPFPGQDTAGARGPDAFYTLSPSGTFESVSIFKDGDRLVFNFLTPTGGPLFDGVREDCD